MTPGLDKLSWRHLKKIVKNRECTSKLINIANVCINLGYWLSHFKVWTTIIIPKLNKVLHDSTKLFCPIVLLNTTRKLFEKIIVEQLQFLLISNDFIHLCQSGRLKHRSTTDAGATLTHFIQSGWIKNLSTSMLTFNIAQFFPLLNHKLLLLILNKAVFDCKISTFFSNYLVNGKTKYLWNSFSSPLYNINIGVSQESALFPILSVLYLSPIFCILEKHLENLKIPTSILSFVDNGLFISQNKSFSVSNIMSQTSFSLYLHNQWTNFHKISHVIKPQTRTICIYMGCIKATTNNWDIRSLVTVKSSFANISWTTRWICMIKLALESAHKTVSNNIWYII